MTNSQEVWNQTKQWYYDKYGIEPEFVDIASIIDILKLCASGSSNKSISNFLIQSESKVCEVVDAYLGFNGWNEDLSFSPLNLYRELESPEESIFVNKAIEKYGYKWNMDLHRMYESARLVCVMEKLLNEKWV